MIKEALKSSISADKQRMLEYKVFSSGFSYPDSNFFKYFPDLGHKQEKVIAQYDLLFRNQGIWLYTTEYTSQGTFQKSHDLCDIMGFYKAFGLEVNEDRPDSLATELEFMHYLIFKIIYALEKKPPDFQEKASLCFNAQSKFFHEYLYPGAKAIAQKIISQKQESIYKDIVQDMLIFLEEEKERLRGRFST